MISTMRAELRKLLTIRSTYLLVLITLLLAGFISFWVFGYKNVENAQSNSAALFNNLYAVISIAGLFMSLVAVLLVGHEYRYNTITYTLTALNSRSKVFFSKLLIVTIFAVAVSALITLASVLLFRLGLNIRGVEAVSQHLPTATVLWHGVIYITGSVVFAYIITALLRNLIGAIAFILVVPTTVEQLLGLLLHENVKYLPYTALGQLLSTSPKVDFGLSVTMVSVYAAVAGLVAWLLFMRRDAN